jgi:hypothetical protein
MQGRLAAGGWVAIALGVLFALVVLGGCFWCLLPTCSRNAAMLHAKPQTTPAYTHTEHGPLCCCCVDNADQPRFIYVSMPTKPSLLRPTSQMIGPDRASVQVMKRASQAFRGSAMRPGVLACSDLQSTARPTAMACAELAPPGHLEISDQCVLIEVYTNCSDTLT